MFVKLTRRDGSPGDGSPVWVNRYLVQAMGLSQNGKGTYISFGPTDDDVIVVQEDPERVAVLLGAGA